MKYLMLPGQVENWVSIVDTENLGIGDFDRKTVMKVLSNMMTNYKCYNRKSYVVNTTFAVSILWAFSKPFLTKNTKSKIMITRSQSPQEMKDLFHPSQLEEKFGGDAPNTEQCWPPILPAGEIGYEPENLLTEEEYEETVRHNNRLKRDPAIQEKFDQEERRL